MLNKFLREFAEVVKDRDALIAWLNILIIHWCQNENRHRKNKHIPYQIMYKAADLN